MNDFLNRTEAHLVLTRLGWLSQQSRAFQALVLRNAQPVHFGAGEVLFRCGDPMGGIYAIVSGAVTVTTAPPADTPRLLHIGMPGGWIGEGPFLVHEPRRVGMQAIVDTWTLHLSLQAMDLITRQDPQAVRRFTRILMGNLDILVRAFYDLQHPDVACRVARALLRVSTAQGSTIPVSQEGLGVMSNALRKQVNAVLNRFTAKGWVGKSYRAVTLLDVQALQKFANQPP